MKKFIQSMTFSRMIILASFVGSAVLGYLLYLEKQKLTGYEDAVPYAKEMVPKIVNRAEELDILQKAASKEDLGAGLSGIEKYVREQAQNVKVHVGLVDIGKGKEVVIASGGAGAQGSRVVDTVYPITPSRDGKGEYTRSEIANFAYLLEQNNSRIKVTRLLMRPTQKGLKDDQAIEDRWTFDIDMSIRSRVEG